MSHATSLPIVVWFRDDLRVSDHPALTAAAATTAPVIAVYDLDEESPGLRPLGGAARWWLAGSLRALARDLRARGVILVLRRGPAARVIPDLVAETGAVEIVWNRRHDPAAAAVDEAVADALTARGIGVATFQASLLTEPDQLRTKAGGPFGVFTPFWRALLARPAPRAPLPAPTAMQGFDGVGSERLEDWRLEPTVPDWAAGLRAEWTPGETGAQDRLARFLDAGLAGYATLRDRPDRTNTSRLSPHLRFGEISPFQVWDAAMLARDTRRGGATAADIDKFLSELAWREFSYHLLAHTPDLATRNYQARFDAFPWRSDPDGLRAWQRGRTGYPIVDAGMRELWTTGWMHNRVRMVVASFLAKHLLIDWREGERWFWDTLVDADPANNAASWQWVAGSGADAAPYFRIFNPVLQGEKFDPDGAYVKQWLPALRGLPAKLVHRPFEATPDELRRAGVALGDTYPRPLVDHRAARERALAALAETRTS
ncbi:deoxyribodipyrimidine photo-lyase [Rhodoplanes sp. TEM]|uniref:Deoxyribodipyrimidine photo-lyase n=1 Tax=Rhodoplanes tepidamans TaxID=200616 RepID=A0ABT5JHF7_RHOTP|nr:MULTISPECIES: deoxyribodipyrimidine photo-lyase [Rhodoplanes]MDC7788853.1 deoxyribodipyrimidine photo-lyase [Rhodoplanes tepidamans]MDC7986482.1 deoxyribodipyrimidine photo-lyase [Rhodoplanes sp. TEM]MDQ0357475.1 deoxyribodipyrimidine photo-lyase [Rhodoplanes tepidamans]